MRKKIILKNLYGFTLIELLVVIAVIAILAAVVFVALNPLARFQDARNAQRWSDVNAIISAIKLYQVDNDGAYIEALDDDNLAADLAFQIGAGSSCADSSSCAGVTLQSNCVDISELYDDGYLPAIPIDPNASGATEDETRYYLIKHGSGTITVGACSEEAGSGAAAPTIVVTR